MPWDPNMIPGPSSLKTTANLDDAPSLGPPCAIPAAIKADPTDVHDPEDTINSTVPFLLSYKAFQSCAAEGHHIPAGPIEAYMTASKTNIRHCACPVCAPLIASQVITYYARQKVLVMQARIGQDYSMALSADLTNARSTLRQAKANVRMQQAKLLKHSDLQEMSDQDQPREKSVGWEGLGPESEDRPSRPVLRHNCPDWLDTSGSTLSYDVFYAWDQNAQKNPDLEQDTSDEEDVSERSYYEPFLPVNRSPSSATIAAALLVAALTFAAAEQSEHRFPHRVTGYVPIECCLHNLPEDPSIPCAAIDRMVMEYAPHASLCMPCARLVSAKRAYFAAKQAHHDLLGHGGVAPEEGEGMDSLLVTLKQAEKLVELREKGRSAMINSDEPINHVICDMIEKTYAYENSKYQHDFEEWWERLKVWPN